MIRHWRLGTLLLGAVWLAAAQSGLAQSSVLAPLKRPWDNTRTLVEGLVAQVPEDKYDLNFAQKQGGSKLSKLVPNWHTT